MYEYFKYKARIEPTTSAKREGGPNDARIKRHLFALAVQSAKGTIAKRIVV
jgi:hypothetical protein